MRRYLVPSAIAILFIIAVAVWATSHDSTEPSDEAAEASEAAREASTPPRDVIAHKGLIRGTVTRGGAPVDRALVSVKGSVVTSALTMADGQFVIDAIPTGEYAVSAVKGDDVSAIVIASPTDSSPAVVQLALSAGVRVSVAVVDLVSRAPIAGAVVVSALGAAKTDAQGLTSLAGDRGRTWLDVSAPGYLNRSTWADLQLAKAGGRIEVALAQASHISGKVTSGSVPVPEATVWGEYLEGARQGERTALTISNAKGEFSIELGEGLLKLVAVTKRGQRARSNSLRVGVGETLKDVIIDAAVDATAQRGTVMRGTEPVVGAQLGIVDARDDGVVAVTQTKEGGVFVIDELPVGRYVVQVRKDSLASTVGPFEQRSDGMPWNVVLSATQTVTGRVEPASAGVRVRCRQGGWAGPPPETVTDASGAFRFDGVTGTQVWLDAEGEAGVATAHARVGEMVVLKLGQSGIVVRVRDGAGKPISESIVVARSGVSGGVRRFPVLAPDGATKLSLSTGPWELSCEASGFGRSNVANVTVGTDAEVVLTIEQGVIPSGTIRDATTKLPIQGARVTVTTGVGVNLSRLSVTTDARGFFRLPSVPINASVIVERDGYVLYWLVSQNAVNCDIPLVRSDKPTPQQAQVNQYEGVGMMLGQRDGRTFVDGVNASSPAEAAGVQRFDVLISIEGAPVGPDMRDTVGRIRGPSGSEVRIEFERAGQRFEVMLRRRTLML